MKYVYWVATHNKFNYYYFVAITRVRAWEKTQMPKSHCPKPMFKNANPNPKTPTPVIGVLSLALRQDTAKMAFVILFCTIFPMSLVQDVLLPSSTKLIDIILGYIHYNIHLRNIILVSDCTAFFTLCLSGAGALQ